MTSRFSNRRAGDDCATCPPKTENIIVIGSENLYVRSGFWLKCMFLSCGFAVAQGRIPPPGWQRADRTTILYVPDGYSRWQLLTLDFLRDNLGVNVVRCGSKAAVLNHLRNRMIDGKEHKIRNLVFFSHGVTGAISLNYRMEPQIDLVEEDFIGLPSNLFVPDGRIYSYACQTAQNGFAQSLADHFNVPMQAYYRRSFYELCLRDPADSDRITVTLRAGRETQEGQKIDIPPDHEAFPHPGLGGGFGGWYGASAEGTKDYALWRKAGAIALPITGSTPPEQPTGFITHRPSQE